MHIFLTGSSGFIGSYFLKHAIALGAKVTTVNRREVPIINEKHINLNKNLFEITHEDFEGIDVIVHLACAGVSPKLVTFSELYEINFLASIRLMQEAIKGCVSRFICTGTAYEYGKHAEKLDKIPPDFPLKPLGKYAETKVAAFYIMKNLALDSYLSFLYPRIFSTYGNGQYRKNFWPSLYNAAKRGEDFKMTNGTQIYDFLKVEIVASLLYQACIRNDIKNNQPFVYNIGSGKPISLYDFALINWKTLGAKGKIIRGAIPERVNQISRLVPDLIGLYPN